MAQDYLCLKWGTLKGWDIKSPAGREALKKLDEAGARCISVAMQRDSPEQKQALLDLIDAIDCETVELDWEGKDVSKEEAKKYVMEYRR